MTHFVSSSIRFAVLAASTLGTVHCAAFVTPSDGGDASSASDGSATVDRVVPPADAWPTMDGGVRLPPGLLPPDCNVTVRGTPGGICSPVFVQFSCGIPREFIRTLDNTASIIDENGVRHADFRAVCLQRCADMGFGQISYCDIQRSMPERPYDTIQCGSYCAGRSTEGVEFSKTGSCDRENSFANYFAEMAQLEAASVVAFEHLASELAALSAPLMLVEWARTNADEERTHTELMTALALQEGSEPARVVEHEVRTRTLLEIAIENRVEGCVRETLGAAVGLWQMSHTSHEGLREALQTIVSDEMKHAEWSWAVDQWAMSQLIEAQRMMVDAAQERAIAQLSAQAFSEEFIKQSGLPSAAEMRAIVANLRTSVWGSN